MGEGPVGCLEVVAGAAFPERNASGSSANRWRQRSLQKRYSRPPTECRCGLSGRTDMPQTTSRPAEAGLTGIGVGLGEIGTWARIVWMVPRILK